MTFADLWQGYVTGNLYRDPASGGVPPGFGNQCAIRLSVTLHKLGVEMRSFTPANVTVKPGNVFGRILLDGSSPRCVPTRWARGWPGGRSAACRRGRRTSPAGTGRRGSGADGDRCLRWLLGADRGVGGAGERGHIDLWNGSRLTNHGMAGSLLNGLRFALGIQDPWIPLYSDLRRAKTILFSRSDDEAGFPSRAPAGFAAGVPFPVGLLLGLVFDMVVGVVERPAGTDVCRSRVRPG